MTVTGWAGITAIAERVQETIAGADKLDIPGRVGGGQVVLAKTDSRYIHGFKDVVGKTVRAGVAVIREWIDKTACRT